MKLMNDIAIIFICDLFSWSATPAYFQIIIRAIVFELRYRLLCILMYVGDIVGLSLRNKRHILLNQSAVTFSEPDAIENDKSKSD